MPAVLKLIKEKLGKKLITQKEHDEYEAYSEQTKQRLRGKIIINILLKNNIMGNSGPNQEVYSKIILESKNVLEWNEDGTDAAIEKSQLNFLAPNLADLVNPTC